MTAHDRTADDDLAAFQRHLIADTPSLDTLLARLAPPPYRPLHAIDGDGPPPLGRRERTTANRQRLRLVHDDDTDGGGDGGGDPTHDDPYPDCS